MHSRMDWRGVRFDWNRVRAYLVTAEEGSFSAAARALGSTQPTVGRQVAALEQELGVALFERVGNTLQPTASGLELLEHARAMGVAANRLSLVAAGQSEAIDGVVRITASQLHTAHLLGPVVATLRARHPGITFELVASNAVRDLRRREADIALRNAAPSHAELIGRRLPDMVARPYATPGYLASLGDDPTATEILSKATFFGFDDSPRLARTLQELGYPVSPANFAVQSEDHLVQWSLARQGLGVCVAVERVGDADPAMIRAGPSLPGLPLPLWLVTHRELHTSRRIRIVFDALADALGG